MMRIMVVLWSVLAAGVGVSLFLLKHEVRSLEDELSDIGRQIQAGDESIHVLKAEWSFLNDPARLRRLAEAHLDLRQLKPEQMTTAAASPMVLAALERSLAETAASTARVASAAPKAVPTEKLAEKPAEKLVVSKTARQPITTAAARPPIVTAAARPLITTAAARQPTPITRVAKPMVVPRGLVQVVSARSVQ